MVRPTDLQSVCIYAQPEFAPVTKTDVAYFLPLSRPVMVH